MVVESTIGGGRSRQAVPAPKEGVGDRNEAGILDGIKDAVADAGRSAPKSLGRDFFHEVKDRMDQKKESTGSKNFASIQKQPMGYRGFADARKHVNHNVLWIRSHNLSQQDSRRGGYTRKLVSGISREFRVVKDNRLNQNAKGEVREVKTEGSHSGNEQILSNVSEKIVARDSDGYLQSVSLKKPSEEVAKAKAADSNASKRLVAEQTQTVSTSTGRTSDSNSMAHSNASSSNSVIGVYSSFSDPVHVPSPTSRSAGKVGAIRREIGVVGVRRQSSDHSVDNSSVSGGSFSTSAPGNDISLETQPSSQPANTSKGNLPDQTSVQVPILHNATSSKLIQSSYHNSKLHQSSGFHQKAAQSNMEWKPKSVQKPISAHHAVVGKDSMATSHTDDCCSSNAVDTTEPCEKFSQVSAARNLHVIIPQHLQVPDLERLKLTFGSFGVELDSTHELSSASQLAGNIKPSTAGPSVSTTASGIDTMAFNMDSFVADHGVILNGQARPFQSGSSASASASEELGPGVNDVITSENIERYDEIGLVQSNSPPYNSSKGRQYQNNPSLQNFSAYDNQPSYDASSFTTTLADSAFVNESSSEVMLSHAASSSPPLAMILTQQEQSVQQQQPFAQLYPQVHIPQYPNFVPFRQFFSPVYVPPMAVSNYSGNPAYSHPSTGNSYLVMPPGGSSHVNAGSMKYQNPQYKPVASGSPTGYGRYSNPTGFAMTPGTVGMMTGHEDMTRHKFKDNLYVPNPQVETSDMWMQTPPELTSLQSSYYNLPGQAPHVGFMPAHAGHGAFGTAAQPSHQQYPGLYHTQPPSLASPHHMMHQHVSPSLGGGIGVGVATPGPQVGTYQQPHVGHFNWTTNF